MRLKARNPAVSLGKNEFEFSRISLRTAIQNYHDFDASLEIRGFSYPVAFYKKNPMTP